MRSGAEKILSLLGFCARARKIYVGVPQICEALQGGKKVLLAVLAEDSSDNTKKRMHDRADFYHIPLLALSVSGEQLAKAVGKTGSLAAVAVCEPHLAAEILKIFQNENNQA